MHFTNLKTSIALVLSLVSLPAFADIYEFIDDAGVSHFSDTLDHDNYVLIIKTEQAITEATPIAANSPLLALPPAEVISLSLSQQQIIAQIELSAKNNQLDSV
jgi:Domain of unknown function (DUF4124)